ncbi:MAG: efflux RND transporter periplasmic adaptor subunit [Microbacteriaceae bacterium]|nr:efflux RND transporter periplasmic adaptor subunit [Burkholderiaceae bacterium]
MRLVYLLSALLATCCAVSLAQAAETPSQCLIEPSQKLEMRSPVSGRIAAIHVERGSVVRKGQVLVTLDADVEQATLAAAGYRSVMEGQIRAAQARLSNATQKHKRRDELQKENFISAQDRDDAAAEMRVAEADLLEARDNREPAKLEARRLTAVVGRYSLLSPISGLVTDRLQNPGELAQTSETNNANTSAIVKLAQIDPLRVDVVLPVARYGAVKVGAVVDIKPEAPFTGVYKATVRIVDRVVDAPSGTFRVRLSLPNPNGEITAGVKCTAAL